MRVYVYYVYFFQPGFRTLLLEVLERDSIFIVVSFLDVLESDYNIEYFFYRHFEEEKSLSVSFEEEEEEEEAMESDNIENKPTLVRYQLICVSVLIESLFKDSDWYLQTQSPCYVLVCVDGVTV